VRWAEWEFLRLNIGFSLGKEARMRLGRDILPLIDAELARRGMAILEHEPVAA
jgi:hypothetical protein